MAAEFRRYFFWGSPATLRRCFFPPPPFSVSEFTFLSVCFTFSLFFFFCGRRFACKSSLPCVPSNSWKRITTPPPGEGGTHTKNDFQENPAPAGATTISAFAYFSLVCTWGDSHPFNVLARCCRFFLSTIRPLISDGAHRYAQGWWSHSIRPSTASMCLDLPCARLDWPGCFLKGADWVGLVTPVVYFR